VERSGSVLDSSNGMTVLCLIGRRESFIFLLGSRVKVEQNDSIPYLVQE
jgi:hypothetical protein